MLVTSYRKVFLPMRAFLALVLAFVPCVLFAGPEAVVCFNEVHYHPAAGQPAGEWIELRNQHSVDVDLSGWRFDGGVDFVFPEGTVIRGGKYLVVAANPGAFQAATGVGALGPWSSVLADGGETLTLRNKNGRMMDEITYGDRSPWPLAADGSGATLAKFNELGATSDPRNWRASIGTGGTPGDYNFTAPPGTTGTVATSQAGVRRYFTFEATVQDASGNNVHGTTVGGPAFSNLTPPALGAGQSMAFDGVDDYVQVLDTVQPLAYTISAWVRPETIRAQSIIVRTHTSGPNSFFSHQLRMNGAGHFEHFTNDGAARTVTGTSVAPAGQWTHVAIVAGNTGAMRLYVNGVEEGTAVGINTLTTGGNRWMIGSNGAGLAFFRGQLDDVAIWHTPFNSAAVQALFATGIKPTDPAPANVALQKEVIASSPPYNADFTAQRVTDGSDTDVFATNYWLGPDPTPQRPPQFFTLDLGAPRDIKQLLIRNTHNTQYNDRGTLSFRVLAAASVDEAKQLISPVQILARTLGRVDGQAPIIAQAYSEQNGLTPTTARYLKFEVLSAVNDNAGLNEFEVYTAFSGTAAGPVTDTHPPAIPLVFNEVAATTAAPFWIELHNYGAARPIGGFLIASESGGLFTIPAQTVPSGGFVTFDATQLGFTPAANEKLFLYTAGKAVVLDAAQAKTVHQARQVAAVPGEFLATTSGAEQTPGALNNITLPTSMVINEIMYEARPQYRAGATPFAVSKEQWVELFNRSGVAVDVGGWRLDSAISYTFPEGTSIPPGGFIVVASDPAAFDAAHPGVTAFGPFNGNLAAKGERVILKDPLGNVVNDVFYRGGKPWPEFAHAGGSSLELRDPWADNSVPEAWAGSDETARSSWANYSFTAVARTPAYTPNIFSFHELRMGLLDAGEVLVDDVSVVEDPAGTNRELMQNGSFSSSTASWRLLGNHDLSNVITEGGDSVLKIVALGATNYHPNGLETSLKALPGGPLVPVVEGKTYRISFRAKWLRGSPQLHCELYYNKVVKTVILAQPATAGTPGAPNSTLVPNLGPTFKDVRHSPVIPAPAQPITVSANINDAQGVNAATIKYLVNGVGTPLSVPMALGADGRWAGNIPGQSASTVIQFWLEAQDGAAPVSALAPWPAGAQNSRALIQVQDNRAANGRQNLRMTMLSADTNAMYLQMDMMSQRRRGCTFIVNESEIFYDGELRLRGSMFTRNSPGNGAFNIYFPADRPFRGVHDKAKFRISGRSEIVIKHLINAAGGLPENYNDIAWMVGPRADIGGTARLELTEFDSDFFDDDAPDGTQGTAFKMEGIRQYEKTVDATAIDAKPESRKKPWDPIGWVWGFDIGNQGDNGTNPELYRHGLRYSSNRAQDDNSKMVAAALAFSQPAGPTLDARVAAAIEVDEWMRCFALQSLSGIGDAYGTPSGNPHNLNFYAPPGAGKVIAVPWDWNSVFANPDNTPLLPNTHNIAKITARPIFQRLFWGHVRDLCETVFKGAYMAPWFSHYGAQTGEGYGSYTSYVDRRRAYALSQLPGVLAFNITTNGGNSITVDRPTTILAGDGWIDVREIHVNGSPEGVPVTWVDGDSWQITVPVAPGTNTVTLSAFNHQGVQVGTDSIDITGTGAVVPATAANLAVSEILYSPASDAVAEFIEIVNIGAQAVDLTGCSFTAGIEYVFPNNTTLPAGGRLAIAQAQFLNGTRLSNEGERLTLHGPGGVVIRDFSYGLPPLWPDASGGRSIVLIAPRTNPQHGDPRSWRVSSAAGGTPGGSDTIPLPADPLGDDNGNGWTNLLEYAVSVPSLTTGRDASERLTLSFLRPLAADEVLYLVETSSDLNTWLGGDAAVERVTQGAPVDGMVVETWRTVGPTQGRPRQFIRLRVQLRPDR